MSSSAFEKMEKYFIPRLKMPLHIIEVIMIIVAIILAGVRLTTITTRTRTDMMAIAMGAKSLVVIAYQLLSEHVAQWKRFASLKANLILNALEIVFWAAVAFMAIQSNTRSCKGASCGLGWGVLVIAILISNISIYMTGISYFAFRWSRKDRSSDSSDAHLRSIHGSAPRRHSSSRRHSSRRHSSQRHTGP